LKLNSTIYNSILSKKGQIAVLTNPDKFDFDTAQDFIQKIIFSKIDFLFIGGSTLKK